MTNKFTKKLILFFTIIGVLYLVSVVGSAVTSSKELSCGEYAVWLNSDSEGYELEIGAFGMEFDWVSFHHDIIKPGDKTFTAFIQKFSVEPSNVVNKYFENYKIKLGKLAPGKYEFILKTSGDYRAQMFLRRYEFIIPDASITSPESEDIKIDLDTYKGETGYDEIRSKTVVEKGKTIISVPLVFKDKESFNVQEQELNVFIYDEEGNEVSKVTDFESADYISLEQREMSQNKPEDRTSVYEYKSISGTDEKFIKNAYKYLRMNYAKIELPLDKLYHIKAVYKINGKEYVKEMNYHNVEIENLKEEIDTNTEYIYCLDDSYTKVKKYTYNIKVNYKKIDSCDEYELYTQPIRNGPFENNSLFMKCPNFISGINEFVSDINTGESCYYVVFGKKGGRYVSRSKIFTVDKKIKISKDGSYIKTDADPIIVNNRVLIPIRVVTESLGGTVNWNSKARTVNIQLKSRDQNKQVKKFEFTIGSKRSKINGIEKSMDVAPTIINNRTYIPIRFLTENASFNINWDEQSKTVQIS